MRFGLHLAGAEDLSRGLARRQHSGGRTAADKAHPDAVYVGGGPIMISQRPKILDYLAQRHLPSISQSSRDYVDGGALIYYADNTAETLNTTAGYVDRILKGANPATMPIEQPRKFDLIINLKTARSLAITIPASILAQATEVISP